MKYDALFIDLDDTVFDSKSLYDQAIYLSWEHMRKFHDIEHEEFKKAFLEAREELKTQFKHMTISHNRAVLFEKLIERFGIRFDAELVQELYRVYWFTVNVYIQPFPGVLPTLEKIKDMGVGLLALSDGSLLSRLEKINALKLSNYFDHLVSSEEVNYTKPEPQIFELAMKKANIKDKESVVFLGNSYSADVVGGKSFGIDTVWFNHENKKIPSGEKYKPDYQITTFPELLHVFEK